MYARQRGPGWRGQTCRRPAINRLHSEIWPACTCLHTYVCMLSLRSRSICVGTPRRSNTYTPYICHAAQSSHGGNNKAIGCCCPPPAGSTRVTRPSIFVANGKSREARGTCQRAHRVNGKIVSRTRRPRKMWSRKKKTPLNYVREVRKTIPP